MTDEKIVDLYWRRDESAVTETQLKYEKYLTKVAYNILYDLEDSMESVNDTYLRAWKAIPPHRPQVLSTFLAKITRRVAIDVVRRRTRNKRVPSEYTSSLSELEECLSDRNTPEEKMDGYLLEGAINNYLRTLPEATRNLFIGRYFYMDSLKEAAKYCGMTESKAKTLLYRTRLGLKEYLEKEGFYL